jgi:hypothetical protein
MKFRPMYLSLISLVFLIACSSSRFENAKAKMTDEVKTILAATNKAVNVEAIEKLTSVEQDAVLSIPKMNVTGSSNVKIEMNKVLITAKLANFVNKQGYDGKTAWEENLITGLRILKGPELDKVISETLAFSTKPEMFYDEIKLIGKEKFNDKECYKLEMIKKGSDSTFEYINTKTNLSEGNAETIVSAQGRMKVITKILSYADHEGGFKYANEVEQIQGPMTIMIKIKTFTLNGKFKPAQFNAPAQ